jgi:hypothetical protein
LSSDEWTEEEDQILIDEYARVGARWSVIANAIKGRSEVAVKNRWKLLYRRTKGSLFTTMEMPTQEIRPFPTARLEAPPLPSEFIRRPIPPLRLPDFPRDQTSAQRDLEAFFRSLKTSTFTNQGPDCSRERFMGNL